MTHPLILRPEAEKDLLNAYRWYDERTAGLGQRFLESVERTLTQIEREPHAFAEIHEGIHRVLTQTFPYGIFYLFEDERTTVLAVVHTSRHPRVRMERTRGAP
jgi:plasmid stabilization system protein ParE